MFQSAYTSWIKLLQYLIFEINQRKWGGGGGWAAHFWDNWKRPWLLFHTQNVVLIFITSCLPFEYHGIYYTNSISNQITGNYWPHTKALLLPSYVFTQETNAMRKLTSSMGTGCSIVVGHLMLWVIGSIPSGGPFSYLLFQPVLHNWYNKGIYLSVCVMVLVKDPCC